MPGMVQEGAGRYRKGKKGRSEIYTVIAILDFKCIINMYIMVKWYTSCINQITLP